MWLVGNAIFSILSARLKNNPDEYLGLIRMMRDPENNSKSYRGYCGLSCMEYSELFRGEHGAKFKEQQFMDNCPNIMVEKPWTQYMVGHFVW